MPWLFCGKCVFFGRLKRNIKKLLENSLDTKPFCVYTESKEKETFDF